MSLFDGTYRRGAAAAATSEAAWLQALLDVQAALARANAAEGLIPAAAAERIADACRAERFDAHALARDAADHATIVIPLLAALRSAVGERDAPHVHVGATSQDIVDTAAMVVARNALGALVDDLNGAVDAARALAIAHRGTPMIGRTLMQQALPSTFGFRAAGWMTGLAAAREEAIAVRERSLWAQMGGPVGTRGAAVAARVASELGLVAPAISWQPVRVPIAALAGALGMVAGVLGKLARDVTLLAQDEVGEAREGGEGRGGSSAMAHKRNPVGAVSTLACTRRAPGLAATLLASMEQEHDRAAGAWQAEWGTLTDLLALTGSAAAWGRELLERLEPDPARMRENLDRYVERSGMDAETVARYVGDAAAAVGRAVAP